MKKCAILIILLLFLLGTGISQNSKDLFPYKGGEKLLKAELNEYLGTRIVANDSAGIYYAEIKYFKKERGIKIEVNGSGKNDSLTKVIENFFMSTRKNWSRTLGNKSVIVPIFVITYCNLQKNGDVNWANLLDSKMPETKDALFVSPLVAAYICSGEPDGDKMEIKKSWGHVKHN